MDNNVKRILNERATAVQWLMENNIPSISPGIGILLLNIESEIRRCGKEIPPEVEEYRHALRLTCEVAAGHQKAVIDKLEELVKHDVD